MAAPVGVKIQKYPNIAQMHIKIVPEDIRSKKVHSGKFIRWFVCEIWVKIGQRSMHSSKPLYRGYIFKMLRFR